jgi:hypothetical protein
MLCMGPVRTESESETPWQRLPTAVPRPEANPTMISSERYHPLIGADSDFALSLEHPTGESMRRAVSSSTAISELQPFPDVPLEQQPSYRFRYKACVPWCFFFCHVSFSANERLYVCVCVCVYVVHVCVCVCVSTCANRVSIHWDCGSSHLPSSNSFFNHTVAF